MGIHRYEEVYDSNSNVWSIKLSDTRYNEYGDNNYYITIGFGNKSSLPKGASTDVDFLKSMPFFTSLKSALQKIEKADSWVDADIKYVRFLYDNIDNPIAHINIIVNDDRNTKDEILSESNFVKNGFMVGNNNLIMKLDKLGVNLLTRKPEPLGSTHPDNKTGKEYFSQSKPLQITDLNYTKIFASNIDERGYNTLTLNNQKGVNKPLHDWIVKEFDAMKLSNPSYGTYGKSKKGSEGRLSLYVHDFMLWLYKNQSNFKK